MSLEPHGTRLDTLNRRAILVARAKVSFTYKTPHRQHCQRPAPDRPNQGGHGMKNHTCIARLMQGGSAIALAAMATAVLTSSALAQGAEGVESVTVSGFKASLERSLDAKRTATGS